MNTQAGGFDPGLAALIAALVSGGVGGVGYIKDTRTAEQKLEEELERKYQGKLVASKDDSARAAAAEAKLVALQKRAADLQTELEQVKRDKAGLAQKMAVLSPPSTTFRNASFDALKKAVDPTIAALKAKFADTPGYEWMGPSALLNLRKALEYPASATGRLARPALSSFYRDRVKPALERDAGLVSGGRKRRYRRRMRGGEGEQIPSEEDFASVYEKAIQGSTISVSDAVDARSKEARAAVDTRVQTKKTGALTKAANILADKLQKAVTAAETELAKQDAIVLALSPDRREVLDEMKPPYEALLAEAKTLTALTPDTQMAAFDVDVPPSLRVVKTEEEWNKLKPVAEKLLNDIVKATKLYTEYVDKAKKQEADEGKLASEEEAKAAKAKFDAEAKAAREQWTEEAKAAKVEVPQKGTKSWAAWFAKSVPEKAPKAKNSDTIHQDLLKKPGQLVKDLKARTKAFQKAWDAAKAARDSLCTGAGGLADYKGGPEIYEKITFKMQEGDRYLADAKQIQADTEAFIKAYKAATSGIKFVADSSFVLSPAEEQAKVQGDQAILDRLSREIVAERDERERLRREIEGATPEAQEARRAWEDLNSDTPEEKAARETANSEKVRRLKENLAKAKAKAEAPAAEVQTGGAFSDLMKLREDFDKLDSRAWKVYKDMDASEVALKKTTEKLETIDSKGPMTAAQRAEEDKERAARAAFRKTPLPMECFPYNYVPPPPPLPKEPLPKEPIVPAGITPTPQMQQMLAYGNPNRSAFRPGNKKTMASFEIEQGEDLDKVFADPEIRKAFGVTGQDTFSDAPYMKFLNTIKTQLGSSASDTPQIITNLTDYIVGYSGWADSKKYQQNVLNAIPLIRKKLKDPATLKNLDKIEALVKTELEGRIAKGIVTESAQARSDETFAEAQKAKDDKAAIAERDKAIANPSIKTISVEAYLKMTDEQKKEWDYNPGNNSQFGYEPPSVVRKEVTPSGSTTPGTADPDSASTTPRAQTATSLYPPNPLRGLTPSQASQRFMAPGTTGKPPGLKGGKKSRRKSRKGRKARNSTLKKRRGGK